MNIECLEQMPICIKKNSLSNIVAGYDLSYLIIGLGIYVNDILRNKNTWPANLYTFKRYARNGVEVEFSPDIKIRLERIKDNTNCYFYCKNDVYNIIVEEKLFDMCYEYLRILENPGRHYGCVCPVCGEFGIARMRDCVGTTTCKNDHSWIPQGYSGIKYKF